MARGGTSSIGPSRRSRELRERIARQDERRRGFAYVREGFACIYCGGVEQAPREGSYLAPVEEEVARIAQVRAAVARMEKHVAEHLAAE